MHRIMLAAVEATGDEMRLGGVPRSCHAIPEDGRTPFVGGKISSYASVLYYGATITHSYLPISHAPCALVRGKKG